MSTIGSFVVGSGRRCHAQHDMCDHQENIREMNLVGTKDTFERFFHARVYASLEVQGKG